MHIKRTDKPADRFHITSKMTGYEKATAGEWYRFGNEPDLRSRTDATWAKVKEINEIGETDREAGQKLLYEYCRGIASSADIVFPVWLDYPDSVIVGENSFINAKSMFISGAKVTIGNNCFIGPDARFYTANHDARNVEMRRYGWQYDAPITIGNDVWFGGSVVVCPGVTIGNNVVVGAGSVVTKDFGDNLVIGGNPAKRQCRQNSAHF